MLKLIFLVAALVLVYWLFRNFQAGGREKSDSAAAHPSPGLQERMVVCDHCRMHVPESESLTEAGRHYCCDEHRRLGSPDTGR